MAKKPISADSHVTEPPNCYIDYIDPKFRDTAPRIVKHERLGEIYKIHGLDTPIPLSLVAAAGKDPSELSTTGAVFDELHRGGWDPKAREADQDRDGVAAEIIYPSVGMMLCNHPDFIYKRACFDAYNRWLQEFCAGLPNRLFGMPQITMASPEEGIEELRQAKEMGFKGVMLVGQPQLEDYHHPIYDPFYEAAVDLYFAAFLPHPHHAQGRAEGLPGTENQRLPVDHPGQPRHHRDLHFRRRFPAPPETETGLRRSRCGLGAALYVPPGPCL